MRTTLLTALGVLMALAIVAIASRGSTPAGEGGAHGPTQALMDIFFTLYLLVIAGSAVLLVYLLILRRQIESRSGMDVRRRRPLETLLTVIVLVGIGSLMAQRLAGRDPLVPPNVEEQIFGGEQPLQTTTSRDAVVDQPEFAWAPAIVTVALIVVALGAWWYAGRARKRARGELRDGRLLTELAAAVDESLDDLRAEPDPRRAVIAAYARLERVLAGHNLPRRAAEAPLEYLARMLDELAVRPEAARRLTNLFERAKFSQHAVAAEMKEEAISALETVRDDLLVRRALAEQARQAAFAAQREKTA